MKLLRKLPKKHDEPLEKKQKNFVSAADTVSADDFVSKSDEFNAHPVSDEKQFRCGIIFLIVFQKKIRCESTPYFYA
ncbi:MAG: hypothetical protein L6V88_04345 [Anaerotruncus sp.]|nr:MAG: hypothetical protein L6V88_04345 [Anaerotruncus sp.]